MVKNNGFDDVAYELDADPERNRRIAAILNELCHVFHMHADGNWKDCYKPKYTAALAAEILERPSLIRKLLALKDPVVSNVTYAAIEHNKSQSRAADE